MAYKLLERRSYIGEFTYGDHIIELPHLAIVDPVIFDAAQPRRKKGRARSVRERKYEYLLAGNVRCTCGMGMSCDTMQKGRYRYYSCNSKRNKPHARGCSERKLRADDAETVVWKWIQELLHDEEKLEEGLWGMSAQRQVEEKPMQDRLTLVAELIEQVAQKVDRLAAAYADESNDVVAAALLNQLKAAGRERDALVSEQSSLQAKLTQRELSDADQDTVRQMANEIRKRLNNATFKQKRALLNILDLTVQVVHKEGARWLRVNCGLTLTPNGEPTWELLKLTKVGSLSSSTTTMSHPTIL